MTHKIIKFADFGIGDLEFGTLGIWTSEFKL